MCIEPVAGQFSGNVRRWVHRQRGVSLLELLGFIMIVGVALAGVLSVLNITTMHSADPMVRKQMLAIAESLMEEIEQKPFTFCDPNDAAAATATSTAACGTVQIFGQPSPAPANRSFFNNVGNYCSNTGPNSAACTALVLGTANSATSHVTDVTGSTSASPAGYWATITLTNQAIGTVPSSEVIHISVTVANIRSSETVTLDGYRTRWMPRI